MQFVEFKPNIYFVRFENQQSMCLTMVRIHEHSFADHPFGKSVFTQKEFFDWYKSKNTRPYDYEVQALCVDGYQLRSFIKKFKKSDMTKDELDFIEMAKNFIPKDVLLSNKKFSVVCTYHGENSIDFKHEVAHALFYMDKEYKLMVKNIFKCINPKSKREIKECLRQLDYDGDNDYMIDEANARLASEHSIERGFRKNIRIREEVINRLKELLKERMGE